MMKTLRTSILCATSVLAVGLATYLVLANVYNPRKHNVSAASANAHHPPKGSPSTAAIDFGILANATVSFGSWMPIGPTKTLDRFPNLSPIAANNHELTPQLALIRAGGTVNFIIAGFHHVLVYDDGTKPCDINTSILIAPTNGGPPLIADPNRRIYRGLDPSTIPPLEVPGTPPIRAQDRVEVVHFPEPGTYLVICGVLPHFNDGMFGFVKVLR
jgi:plastocyanin